MKLPIVINGPHEGDPVGHLEGPNGEIITIWSLEPGDLLFAMTQAIGPIPSPPGIGFGGEIKVVQTGDPSKGIPPIVMYDPSGDVSNQVAAQQFQSLITAWNTRASLIASTIQALIQSKVK